MDYYGGGGGFKGALIRVWIFFSSLSAHGWSSEGRKLRQEQFETPRPPSAAVQSFPSPRLHSCRLDETANISP